MTITVTTKAQVVPTPDALHALDPLTMDEVTFTDGFWAHRQAVNATGTIPHSLAWEERVGWIDNFVRAASGTIAGHHAGLWFADSDVYKLIEAMAWEVGRTGDPELESEIQRLGALIEAVQDEDGYLNTRYGKPGVEDRYTDFPMGHELYCTGHLTQAAVARLRCGKGVDDVIVRTALRNADHVCSVFGRDGKEAVCGHPEVEVALVELYRATGRRRYLDQAQVFVDRRGHGLLGDIQWGREYFQDETPVRQEVVARGHAVRALYLMAGAIDVAVERGDVELLNAVRSQYDRTLARRTYITGGMGARHDGEAFGEDFELPADRSYCETCAGVASIMVAWRLLLATADTRYADVVERTLYNVVAVSPSADGRSFFYANPVQVRVPGTEALAGELSTRSGSSLRAPWFEVSCCPTNIARTLAALAGASVTRGTGAHGGPDATAIQIHHLTSMDVRTTVPGPDGVEADLALSLRTSYPEQGRIVLSVAQAPTFPVSIAVRVPSWARGTALLDGVPVDPEGAHGSGYAVVSGVLKPGQEHVIEIPVEPRVTVPDPRIDAVRGCVAIERGPLVLCAESADLPEGLSTEGIELAPGSTPRVGEDGRVTVRIRRFAEPDGDWAYSPASPREPLPGAPGAQEAAGEARDEERDLDLALTPYHAWGNRGPVTMRIWLPTPSARSGQNAR